VQDAEQERAIELKSQRRTDPADSRAELRAALEHQAAGRFGEAALEYQRILDRDPHHPDATLLLGIAARESGLIPQAIEVLTAAVRLQPRAAHVHWNLGLALRTAGDLPAAEACFRRALELRETFRDAHLSLGDMLVEQEQWAEARRVFGRLTELHPGWLLAHARLGDLLVRRGDPAGAIMSYERALALASSDAAPQAAILSNLGLALQRADRLDDSIAVLRRAALLTPESAEIFRNLGEAYARKGNRPEAIRAYAKSLQCNADDASVHNNLANTLIASGRRAEAIEFYRKALALKPDDAGILRNLGNALVAANELEEAERYYIRGLERAPDSAELLNSYASLLLRQGRPDAAEALYRRSVALDPLSPEVHSNLGTLEMRRGRPAAAVPHYEHALRLKPDSAGAHYNLSLCLLMQGDYPRGWHEHEWRWGFRDLGMRQRHFSQPLWRGEPLHGARILLEAEQGFGDTLQFVRYVPLVAARGGEVILQVQPALRRLMENLPGVSQLLAVGDPLPSFAWQCPLMSLPRAFATTVETIPNSPAYLSAPAADRSRMQAKWARQGKPGKPLRVGLTWAGNPRTRTDLTRSMPLQTLIDGLRQSLGPRDVELFSLQQGVAADQISQLPEGWSIHDACRSCADFAETAALVETLNLVIAVDTAVAHLAGALGKTVWVLVAYASDWRWMMEREDSPWYPTARIFRQTAMGDWPGVAERVGQELKQLLRAHQDGCRAS